MKIQRNISKNKYNQKYSLPIHLAITGTPGTGKSTVAKQVSKILNIPIIDVTLFIKENKIFESYDKRDKTYNVSINKLESTLRNKLDLKGSYILDSHLSHHLSSKLVSHVLVCSCDLKTLNKRLLNRKYSSHKIRDNLDAEIFSVCETESVENGHKTLKINNTKKINQKELNRLLLLLQQH